MIWSSRVRMFVYRYRAVERLRTRVELLMETRNDGNYGVKY